MKQLTEPLEAHYRDIVLLHEGAHVTTYAAVHAASATEVVIKMLDFKKIQAWKALELFEREAAVLQRLSHPAIPEYRDAFQADYEAHPYSCLVQKRVPGKTLQQWIEAGYRFTEAEMRLLATQLLEVMHYLHGFRPPIIHRDIKPDNLIWHQNTLSVLDFGGVLKHLGPAQSTVVGTYGYMAPEQFQGKARIESDLYSVGMTLAHALSHVHPSHMQSRGLSIDIASHLQCSAGLLQWLKTLTALEPEDRFHSAHHALSALDYLAGDKQQALQAAHAQDIFVPSVFPVPSQPPLPAPTDLDLTGIELVETPEHTALRIHRKNGVASQTALKIDLFVIFPGLLMAGALKWAGVSWLYAALLPSCLLLPVAAFFVLMLHYSHLHLELTPGGVDFQKRVGPLTLQRHHADVKAADFKAQALGAVLQNPDPQAPASLRLRDAETAEERVLHLGLPLVTYAYLAAQLNAKLAALNKHES